MDRYFALTLDLEPDCGGRTNRYEACRKTTAFENLIKKYNLKFTTFVTGKILDMNLDVVERFSELGSDFGLHSYSHDFTDGTLRNPVCWEISEGRKAFIRHFGISPKGYRAPQGKISISDFSFLEKEGFSYDTSVFPSFRPGVFNFLTAPTEPYYPTNTRILEIPFCVTPVTRIPFTLSYTLLVGFLFYRLNFALFGFPRIVVFDFHLHNMIMTSSVSSLPSKYKYLYSKNVDLGLSTLEKIITFFKERGYKFVTIEEIFRQYSL